MSRKYRFQAVLLFMVLVLINQSWASGSTPPPTSTSIECAGFLEADKPTLLLNSDSTEGAKAALAAHFRDDPQNSLEKNWKRVKKWNVYDRVYRSFRSNNGQEAVVIYNNSSKTNSVIPKPELPQGHFLFAIDRVGMSIDEEEYPPSKYPAVVIITRELFEEEAWVPDHMESDDANLLAPVLEYLGLNENMSNEFQAGSPIKESELTEKLIELGLVYDRDLQRVVDEMGKM